MRYFKVFLLILFFFIAMVFFVQNTDQLGNAVSLRLQIFQYHWKSIPFPFYLLILIFFVIGALFTLAFFLAEKIRAGRELRQCRHKVASLQQELNSLRNLPLEDESMGSEEKTEI